MTEVTFDSQITFDDFAKVDIRVGRIVQVDDFPKARKPAFKLRIDFGDLGVKRIADFHSEVLTLGVVLDAGDVVLVAPDRDVPLGGRIA